MQGLRFNCNLAILKTTAKGNMNKKIIVGAALALAAIAGYFGYSAHQDKLAIDIARPAVKVATIYVTDFLENETKSSSITFGEYFKKSEDAVSEIDKKIIELRSLRSERNAAAIDEATKNMKIEQDLIRELSKYYRHTLAFSNASDRYDRASKALRVSTSSYEAEWRAKDARSAIDDKLEALGKMKEANESAYTLLGKVKDSQATMGKIFGQDILVPTAILNDALKKFGPADEAKK